MSAGMLIAGDLCCCATPDPSEACVTGHPFTGYFITVHLEWAATLIIDPVFGNRTTGGDLELFGQRTDGGGGLVCYYGNTAASSLSYTAGGPSACSSASGFPIDPWTATMQTSTGGGVLISTGGTHDYRFWRAQGNQCYTEQSPTVSTITITNTKDNTIRVNGTNLAPGYSRVISSIVYAGFGARNQSGYGGGTTVEIFAGCA